MKLWEAMGAVGAAAQALVGVIAWMDQRHGGEGNLKGLLLKGSSALFILLILVVVLITAGRYLRKLPVFSAMQQWLAIWAVIAGATWVFLSLGWFDPDASATAATAQPKVAAAAPTTAPVAAAAPVEVAPPPIVIPENPMGPVSGMVETADSQAAWIQAGGAQASAGSLLPRPSFDCANATASSELAICGDEQLANLDRRLADLYVRRLNVNPLTRDNQQAWLGARNAACGADATCIKRMTTARMVALQSGAGIPVPPPPAATQVPAGTAPAAPAAPPAKR